MPVQAMAGQLDGFHAGPGAHVLSDSKLLCLLISVQRDDVDLMQLSG